jgi:hypothetical protein
MVSLRRSVASASLRLYLYDQARKRNVTDHDTGRPARRFEEHRTRIE